MKEFVRPKLNKGTEFILHGRMCVVKDVWDEMDTYQGHPSFVTKMRYYLKDNPNCESSDVSVDYIIQEMYRYSDEKKCRDIEDHLEEMEYIVKQLEDVSDKDKTELFNIINQLKQKLESL